jgi:arylsulfatase
VLPDRAALLTGRNHHLNNLGAITELATAFPGNTGIRPNSVAPLAETLRLNGYSTAAFGKWHETPTWDVSPSGPTSLWPTRSGFDKFYGFMGGETNQYVPALYQDLSRIEIPHDPNYHLMTDMTDKAIRWVEYQKSLTPDKPFFIYFAPGAVHAPHQVSKAWIDKYPASLTRAGTSCASRRSPAKSSWAWFRQTQNSRRSLRPSRIGRR